MRSKKETKILMDGASGDRGLSDQNESPIPDAIVRFSGTRRCGDIDDLNFLMNFFLEFAETSESIRVN